MRRGTIRGGAHVPAKRRWSGFLSPPATYADPRETSDARRRGSGRVDPRKRSDARRGREGSGRASRGEAPARDETPSRGGALCRRRERSPRPTEQRVDGCGSEKVRPRESDDARDEDDAGSNRDRCTRPGVVVRPRRALALRRVARASIRVRALFEIASDQAARRDASPASPPPFLHIPSYPGTRITCLHAPHDTKGAPGGGWTRLEQLGHAMTGGVASADAGAPGKAITW